MKIKDIYNLYKNSEEKINLEIYDNGKLIENFEYPTVINKAIEEREIQGIIQKEKAFQVFLKINQ